MKFYKFRQCWSSGRSNWDYIRLPEGETPKSFFNEMAREYDWSEHFRGIDYKKATPPKKWFESQITHCEDVAKGYKSLANQYKKLL